MASGVSDTILVAGATGFTGGYTVPLLARRGYRLRCLVRPGSDTRQLENLGVELVHGDLDAPESLDRAFSNVSGLISMVGLHTGHAGPLVDRAVSGKIKRALFVSSTSVFTRPDTPTKINLRKAEKHIRAGGLNYTVIRPTMVYGADSDGNISRLIRYLARWPVLFIPGPGTCLVQPIFVEDAAAAIADAFQASATIGKSYNIAGQTPLTFNRLVDTVLFVLKRKVARGHLPVQPLVRACKWAEARGRSFFVRADQIERLNEDKAFAYDEAVNDFQFSSVSFETGVRRQISAMGLMPAP